MKIQIITHATEYEPKSFGMRWHRLPTLFERAGHKVDHILKQDWKYFYFRYLKFKPDVVICAGTISILPVILRRLHLIRVPVVFDWNDHWTDVMGRMRGIDRVAFLEHYIIKHSKHITTPGKFMQKKCEMYGQPAAYIPHGASMNLNQKPVKLKGKVKVIYVGSQTKYKHVDKIIDAVRGLECQLYMLGEINKEMESKAPENAHFLGMIRHAELPRYLMAADILILAVEQDTALKMFEYIKAGKCILASKGRIGYFLDHNVNAYLAEDLSAGMEKLIKDKKLRDRLAKNVKKIKVFTWEEIAIKYLQYLEDVTKR